MPQRVSASGGPRGVCLGIRWTGSGVLFGTRIADNREGDGKIIAGKMIGTSGQRGMASGRRGEGAAAKTLESGLT